MQSYKAGFFISAFQLNTLLFYYGTFLYLTFIQQALVVLLTLNNNHDMNTLPRRISKIYRLHVNRHSQGVQLARERILFGIMSVLALAGSLAYFPSVYAAFTEGLYDVIIIDSLIFFGFFFLLLSTRLNYRQRALILVYSLLVLAIFLVVRFGLLSAGLLWLFMMPILATLLLSYRHGLWLVFLVAIVLISVGILQHHEIIMRDYAITNSTLLWALVSGNFILLNLMATVSIGMLLQGLERSLNILARRTEEVLLTQDVTIDAMASLAEYRDHETGNHILRTQHYVKRLAELLQFHESFLDYLNTEKIDLLYRSAPLHDIGKVGVPDNILLKPGKLTSTEFEEMKKHTEIGHDALLKSEHKLGCTTFLSLAAEIAYSHHEKWDGSGYPRGLKGIEIPISGRIMAVADVYDALISRRVYKEPFSHSDAIDYINNNATSHFDPDISQVLIDNAEEFRNIAIQYADSDEERDLLVQNR